MGFYNSVKQNIARRLVKFIGTTSPFRVPFSIQGLSSPLRRKQVAEDVIGNYAGWAYAAISKRAKRVGAINLRLFEMRRNEIEEIEDHELLALLFKANPVQSKYQFFYTIEMFSGIWGSAPIFTEKNEKGKIQNLWPLRPDLLKATANTEGQIVKYEYRVGHKTTEIKAEDIIFINEPNPEHILKGMSPMNAAALEIDADVLAAIWNKHLIENWGEPSMVFETDQELGDEEFERLKREMEAKYSGPANAGRSLILEMGLKANPVGRSPKEMELGETRKFNRDAISTILGVPIGLLTDVRLANAEVAERVFASDTIKPQMELIISTFNEFLAPKYGENLWLEFDSPIAEDVESKTAVASAGEGRWLTVNEAREMFGLPALKGGDAIYKPLGVFPQVQGEKSTITGYERIEMKTKPGWESARDEKIRKAILARTFRRRKFKKEIEERVSQKILSMLGGEKEIVRAKIKDDAGGDDDMDPRLKADRIDYVKRLPVRQQEFRTAMQNYFKQQQDIVLDNLKRVGVPKSQKLNPGRWVNQIIFPRKLQDNLLVETSESLYGDNILDGVNAIRRIFGLDPSSAVTTPFVTEFIQERSFNMLSVNETTREQLKEQLNIGLAEGEGVGKIGERIEKIYAEAIGFRSETIARTEVGGAQNFGRYSEMIEQKVENKVWIATFSNTRDSHMAAHNQVVRTDESFDVGGERLMFPGDPSGSPGNIINCQCSSSPTLRELT